METQIVSADAQRSGGQSTSCQQFGAWLYETKQGHKPLPAAQPLFQVNLQAYPSR
jgi:hypothetical protein